jgi:preprotein translocase subunit SecY
MMMEEGYIAFLKRIPGIAEPVTRLTFKSKLKWTGLILLIYFAMTQIHVFGIPAEFQSRFQLWETLLGSSFGTLMTLGIGPIVTASIILQLLVGSKIIPWDLTTDNGRVLFQGTQKFLAIIFSFLEAGIYVVMGAVPAAAPGLVWIVILQVALGGILVIFMDELISKWGFGSGVGLFIVAGVSKTIILRAFNPLSQGGGLPTPGNPSAGIIPFAISAVGAGEIVNALFSLLPIIATVIVFVLVVYTNAIRVEIPLAFGSIRGFGRRWPLKFFYTSNIPVILIAALLANVQLMGRMFADRGMPWLGTFSAEGVPESGLVYFLSSPSIATAAGQSMAVLLITMGVFALLGAVLAYFTKRTGWKLVILFAALGGVVEFLLVSGMGITALTSISLVDLARFGTYAMFMIGGAVVFSVFWVATAGMDARSVANQIQSTGMQIPGYRRDIRIIERVLNRYIPGLAILGGAAVGFLAAYADFTGALGTGTGILLATLIIYNLYEELAMQHMEDMHPAVRKLLGR